MAEEQASVAAQDTQNAESQARTPRRRAAPKPATETMSEARIGEGIKLFGKYDYDVEIADISLRNYINLKPMAYPASYRRTSQNSYSKADLNIVERLANSLMRGGTGAKISGHVIRTKGRLQGKKLKVVQIIEKAFDSINRQSGKNPLQVYIRALENSAPIEDTTRVVYGGISSNVAVDISASRRLDTALRNIAMAAIIGAFNGKRTLSDALANEITMAANLDVNSYAVKRKNEIERMARSAK
ncbi:MAG: 30S ribosomal protein S7 [Candidatus Micrarchaeaceae archaeon]